MADDTAKTTTNDIFSDLKALRDTTGFGDGVTSEFHTSVPVRRTPASRADLAFSTGMPRSSSHATTSPSTSAFADRRVNEMLEMSVPHSRVHWSPNHKL